MSRAVLVLCSPEDGGATAVARLVARRGLPTAVVDGPELARARWRHTVATTGAATTVTTARGSLPDDVGAVLRRIDGIPAVSFARSGERDRAYAATEWQALFVSWLHGLGCPVLNPVDGDGPTGPRSDAVWCRLASRHGVPIAPWSVAVGAGRPGEGQPHLPARPEPDDTVTVVGDRAFGPLAGAFGEACVATAAAVRCPLLRFSFAHTPSPALVSVDALPDLRPPPVAEAVADLLSDAAG